MSDPRASRNGEFPLPKSVRADFACHALFIHSQINTPGSVHGITPEMIQEVAEHFLVSGESIDHFKMVIETMWSQHYADHFQEKLWHQH